MCPIGKAKVTVACYVAQPEGEPTRERGERVQLNRTVIVDGQTVTALLDTGSQMSLVKHILVPVGSVDYSRKVDILCVHGDKHPYSKSDLTVTIDEKPYLLTVVDKLIVDFILGVDLPVLMSLLQEKELSVELDSGEKVEVNGVEGLRKSCCQSRIEKQLKSKDLKENVCCLIKCCKGKTKP